MSGILTDVDGFNVMMYPKDIIKHFGRGQVVSLASHYQKLQDLPAFDKMMTLGRGSFIWRVDQEYKTPLINSLSSSFSLPLLPAPHKQAFIRGTRSVTAKMLCDALDAVGCESVRISAYGFKCPRTRFPDFANMIHPEVHTNTWDFAVNYRSNKIPLVSSRNILDSSVCTEYPMLGPLGGGFGSLKYKIKHNDHDYTVKIYPRLVHAIKAVSGNLVQFAPDTVNTLRKRKTNIEKLLDGLSMFQPSQLCGLRIEVTTTGGDVLDAMLRVSLTPILSYLQYLTPTQPAFMDLAINIAWIEVDDFTSQAHNLLEHADKELKIFRGSNLNKTTPKQRRVCMDLFQVVGWNPGTFKFTKWDKEDAWWALDELPSHDEVIIQKETHPLLPDDLNELAEVQDPLPPPPPTPEIVLSVEDIIEAMDKARLKTAFLQYKVDFVCSKDNCSASIDQTPGKVTWDGDRAQFRVKCSACKARYTQRTFKALFIYNLDLPHFPDVVPDNL
ncbi:hypothetical protein A4X13_0g8769 [Tilletia indica]|uniref:Uncharacterized protein n=1 Tax=Tilletia indica TaxID=43049 RepID=A0A177TEN3_9BASI|nr:hypothetical protein A4X13_0g8769 [Tilletia indica]